MKRTRTANSGLFIPRVLLACSLCCAALSVAMLGFAASPSQATQRIQSIANPSSGDWRSKVDPAVLTSAQQGYTEFLIELTTTADLSGTASLPTKREKGRYVFQQLTTAAESSQPIVRQTLQQLGAEFQSFWVANVIWTRGNLNVLETVAALPQVARIVAGTGGGLNLPPQSSNKVQAPTSIEATAAIEGSLLSVDADDVWNLGYLGQGAVIAGADSGVRWTHSALKTRYRGWNGSTVDHNYNWKDGIHNPNSGCPADSPEPCDDDVLLGGGHGSHTMGTMVGDDGGNNRIGMAPGARWIACRNMNHGVGVPVTGYLECMQFFLAPTDLAGNNPNPDLAPDVINNSWGCVEPGCVPEPNPPAPGFLRATLQASKAAGIFYVVSAGNEGNDGTGDCSTLQFPLARYPESFTVGAINHQTDFAADFSSRGPVLGDPDFPTGLLKPDISAPGVSIRSSLRGSDNQYGSLSGTSMSGPHVAGLVALIISANPKLAGNVDHIAQIIKQSAVPKTTTQACGSDTASSVPNNVYGWGKINALAAVNVALAEATAVPLVDVISRKTHGTMGVFDIALPLNDSVGIECRTGQPNTGDHTVVFRFLNPLANVTRASVTSGNATVSSSTIGADQREYVVKLSGVTNSQKVTIALNGVTDSEGNSTPTLSVTAGFLLGDVSSNSAVSNTDVSNIKGQVSTPVSASNFRHDVTANGGISNTDVSAAKGQVGTTIP